MAGGGVRWLYLHPELLVEHDINAVVCYLEIRLELLLQKPYVRIEETPVSRYPSMERDPCPCRHMRASLLGCSSKN